MRERSQVGITEGFSVQFGICMLFLKLMDELKCLPAGGTRGKIEKLLILWGTRISVPNVMAIRPVFVMVTAIAVTDITKFPRATLSVWHTTFNI